MVQTGTHALRVCSHAIAVSSAPLPLIRKILYTGIATVLGTACLLGATELALRIAGYGYSPHFARRSTRGNDIPVWRENRWCTAPYFSPELVRRPVPFSLPIPKPAGTYRIFVLGSSAAMGDPEPSFSLARMLTTLLQRAYPHERFEVVNAGITAINSHVVRGIAEDCTALEPDLFVVYEGNNEVIGPFGPSGVFAPFLRSEAAVRTAVWAKGTRTGQALNALGRLIASKRTGPIEWGGMQMFLDQQIPLVDPRLDDVAAHFQANLLAIARSAHRAGASTLLCTVLTNQRDFAPFMSRHRAGLSAADLARWNGEVTAAIAAEREHRFDVAEQHFRRALEIDDEHAELVFRLGRLMLQVGRDAEARSLLGRAQDLDTLRFRTDSRLNNTIRAAAAIAPGATLVDLARDLADESAHGIPGDDLLYEHVHLNFRGTYDAAKRILPFIVTDLKRRGIIRSDPAEILSIDQMRQELGYTTYEQTMIAIELRKRFRAPPFTGQIDDGLRVETWARRVQAGEALLSRPEATDALASIYSAALRASPDDWVIARNAGSMLVARGRPAEAIPLLRHALENIPDDADTLAALALAYRGAGEEQDAVATFAKVRALEPHHPLLPEK